MPFHFKIVPPFRTTDYENEILLFYCDFLSGIIQFGPTSILNNRFNNKYYHNKANLNRLVGQRFARIAKEYGTRIDIAERLALYQLFTPSGGDRRDAANIMLIFTDGRPTGWDQKNFTPFKHLTAGLEVC